VTDCADGASPCERLLLFGSNRSNRLRKDGRWRGLEPPAGHVDDIDCDSRAN